MSTKSNGHPKSLILIGIYIAILVVSFVMIQPEYARSLRVSEAKGAASILGETRALESIRTGNGIFNAMFADTGMIRWSYETANAHRNGKAPLFNREKTSESMIAKTDTFWEMVRLTVQRTVFLFYWIPVLIPFMLAATVDGVMAREIRKWRFQFTSTTIYNHSRRMAGAIVFVGLMLPVLPVSMPILVYPVALMLSTLMGWASIATMQKRI